MDEAELSNGCLFPERDESLSGIDYEERVSGHNAAVLDRVRETFFRRAEQRRENAYVSLTHNGNFTWKIRFIEKERRLSDTIVSKRDGWELLGPYKDARTPGIGILEFALPAVATLGKSPEAPIKYTLTSSGSVNQLLPPMYDSVAPTGR